MKEYLNDIITNTSSTKEQVSLARKWLELENINIIPIYNKECVQILSPHWEEEILLSHISI